jgi:hypothetical protein
MPACRPITPTLPPIAADPDAAVGEVQIPDVEGEHPGSGGRRSRTASARGRAVAGQERMATLLPAATARPSPAITVRRICARF